MAFKNIAFAPEGASGGGDAPAAPAAAQAAAPAAGATPAAAKPAAAQAPAGGRGLTDLAKPGVDNAKPDAAGKSEAGKDGAPPDPPPGPYKPKDLDAKYLGKTDQETIDNLAKANKSFRDTIAKRGATPDTPDGYKFELPAELKDKVTLEGDGNKAALGAFSAIFHEEGLTQTQAENIFRKVMALSVAEGWSPDMAPADNEAWLQAQMQELGGEQQARRRNAELQAYGAMAVERKAFTPEMKADFDLMIGTATGVRVIEALLAMNGVQQIPLDTPVPGKRTREELDREMASAQRIKDPSERARRLGELRDEFAKNGY